MLESSRDKGSDALSVLLDRLYDLTRLSEARALGVKPRYGGSNPSLGSRMPG